MTGPSSCAPRALLLVALVSCSPTNSTDSQPGAAAPARALPAACEAYVRFYEDCLRRLPREEQQRRAPLFEVQKRSFHAVALNAVTDSARAGLERSCEEARQQASSLCPRPR